MNLFSYEENGIIVRPVAADFMELADEVEDKVEEIKEIPLSDEEKKNKNTRRIIDECFEIV